MKSAQMLAITDFHTTTHAMTALVNLTLYDKFGLQVYYYSKKKKKKKKKIIGTNRGGSMLELTGRKASVKILKISYQCHEFA